MTLLIQENFINATKHHSFGDCSEPYEAFTDDIGRLYRSLASEYGRCVSKVYLDTASKGTVAIGWVFQKQMPYEDVPKECYLREVWVTLFEPCELDDPDHLQRATKHGVEHVRLKHKVLRFKHRVN